MQSPRISRSLGAGALALARRTTPSVSNRKGWRIGFVRAQGPDLQGIRPGMSELVTRWRNLLMNTGREGKVEAFRLAMTGTTESGCLVTAGRSHRRRAESDRHDTIVRVVRRPVGSDREGCSPGGNHRSSGLTTDTCPKLLEMLSSVCEPWGWRPGESKQFVPASARKKPQIHGADAPDGADGGGATPADSKAITQRSGKAGAITWCATALRAIDANSESRRECREISNNRAYGMLAS